MRVLVTGAAGFIGAEVVRALLENGHAVVAVDQKLTGAPRLAGLSGHISRHEVDLGDSAAVRRLLEPGAPDAVIHLAWYANPRDYLTAPENLASLQMTVQFADAVLRAGCPRFVGAGTGVEYANAAVPRVEGDAEGASSLYAACKLGAGHVVRALGDAAGATVGWGRVFHLHGPRESPERLVPWVAAQLRAGVAVELTDGSQIRDHLHVGDVARAFVALAETGAPGVTNICSGEPVSLRAVLETVGRLAGRPELLHFGARPQRAGEVMFLAGDNSRLRALGWRPRFNLEAGLRDALG